MAVKPLIGHGVNMPCALLSVILLSEEAMWKFRLRLLGGRPMPSAVKRLLSPVG